MLTNLIILAISQYTCVSISLYALNLYNIVYQLYLNKPRRKTMSVLIMLMITKFRGYSYFKQIIGLYLALISCKSPPYTKRQQNCQKTSSSFTDIEPVEYQFHSAIYVHFLKTRLQFLSGRNNQLQICESDACESDFTQGNQSKD